MTHDMNIGEFLSWSFCSGVLIFYGVAYLRGSEKIRGVHIDRYPVIARRFGIFQIVMGIVIILSGLLIGYDRRGVWKIIFYLVVGVTLAIVIAINWFLKKR